MKGEAMDGPGISRGGNLVREFLKQGNGKLSGRVLRKEISALTEGEVLLKKPMGPLGLPIRLQAI